MTDERPTQDDDATNEGEVVQEPQSRWARLDELDPPPDRPKDDRLKGLPINPGSLGG